MDAGTYRLTMGIAMCMLSLAPISMAGTAGIVAGLVVLGVGVGLVVRHWE